MSHDRFEVDRRLGQFANIGARALQPWNIGKGLFHRLGGVQQLLITAKAARDLQTERHGVLIDSAWNTPGMLFGSAGKSVSARRAPRPCRQASCELPSRS